MQMATMKIDNLDLFGFANMQAIEQQREKNELKRIETMKLVRCDWFIAVTSTGELFKYSEKVPAKYKAFKGIKLFKCWNEATADLVLNAVKAQSRVIITKYQTLKKAKSLLLIAG
jgi:poly-gamma-glutamate capsule biosynthesis protein CapA/YwtB (metallophosphatase superfamily)